jgi:GTP-binding protein YchF
MDVAIIGLPQSGKTTVFNALTKGNARTMSGGEVNVGVVKVADSRVDGLTEMYVSRKTIYAEIKYWDLPGPESLAKSQGIGGRYLNVLEAADAFLVVVRTFTDPVVPFPTQSGGDGPDPRRDLSTLLEELAWADLIAMERAVERLEDGIKKSKPAVRPALVNQLDAVRKVKSGLEEGTPLRQQQLTASESASVANYQLLTGKPVIVVFNTDETGPETYLADLELTQHLALDLGQVSLCGKLEADLALMPEEEAAEFRSELGLGESAVSQVVKLSYQILGLVSFLTVGDDEVRAWSVPLGTPAQQAAGTIHTDFQRGFIRAEVIPYDDLVRCGSISQGRKEGVLRSEGKTYPVQDGDVINFLVNV